MGSGERTLKRSNLHFERALERLPLGVAADCRYWGDDRTFYVKRASGARLWDIDDNEYIDYRLGRGQAILGYADPRVAKAARAGIEVGGVFALATEREFTVAERIAKMVPAAELVRFSNSGAEAAVDALRVARSFTGKDAFAVVDGGSHGLLGAALWDTTHQNWPAEPNPPSGGTGVRGPFDSLIHSVPGNDANGFEELLRRHGDQIAAFLIEPIPVDCASTAADAEYLGDVRALCDRFEVVLIIDEVTTGFRVARGGAQEVLGVRADLCTFGSSMANGFPIAALAGREEIMRRIGKGVVQGSSYAAHPVSLAAADKTLEILDETDVLERIAKYGWRMREGMSQVLVRRGLSHAFVGPPSMSGLRFGESAQSRDRDREKTADAFCGELAPRLHASGILCEPDFGGPWFVSAAHNELCLAETLAKFEHAADATLERLPNAQS
ncbi:MAG: aminotransferase class III-fold pyridoxal phosphate-dependent enzyme [Myxococcales bacterium]|nr:aminotransferase class III-fold pyridoxal phosphate-dependent enzyme [Myxococcales bacterium]